MKGYQSGYDYSSPKLKVGDNVKCIYNDNGSTMYVGLCGRITGINNKKVHCYDVDFASATFSAEELELIPVIKNKYEVGFRFISGSDSIWEIKGIDLNSRTYYSQCLEPRNGCGYSIGEYYNFSESEIDCYVKSEKKRSLYSVGDILLVKGLFSGTIYRNKILKVLGNEYYETEWQSTTDCNCRGIGEYNFNPGNNIYQVIEREKTSRCIVRNCTFCTISSMDGTTEMNYSNMFIGNFPLSQTVEYVNRIAEDLLK